MRHSPKKAPLLVIRAGAAVLLLCPGIVGLFGALSAARSGSPRLQPKYEHSEARTLDSDIYFWRGALLGPAAVSRGHPIGMFVGSVSPDSAAARAKLDPGDIVTGLDGMPVGTPRLLALAVADHPIGPTIGLQIWRDGSERQLSLLMPSPCLGGDGGAAVAVG